MNGNQVFLYCFPFLCKIPKKSHTNLPNYPENGKTYGSAEEATSVEMLPDLIHAGSVNGIAGYVLKKIISVNLVVMSHCMMLMVKP
ncbi:hypothetical protein GC098_07715 [Paenibacillus sp. LMG 31458]|uniref:Uncharacterized protein n=1 Tax=Paenibacillus phytorum TaxID=2654977 RepID=A0ABX1XRY5_9BACL|nr:hypothetical protein [Paenibacillus phytorum]NOU71307.1 hypothetical protein [Paenibacillus phytorum]